MIYTHVLNKAVRAFAAPGPTLGALGAITALLCAPCKWQMVCSEPQDVPQGQVSLAVAAICPINKDADVPRPTEVRPLHRSRIE